MVIQIEPCSGSSKNYVCRFMIEGHIISGAILPIVKHTIFIQKLGWCFIQLTLGHFGVARSLFFIPGFHPWLFKLNPVRVLQKTMFVGL